MVAFLDFIFSLKTVQILSYQTFKYYVIIFLYTNCELLVIFHASDLQLSNETIDFTHCADICKVLYVAYNVTQ